MLNTTSISIKITHTTVIRITVALLSVSLMIHSLEAQAKRMGSGRSMGKQSQNVTQRSQTPAPSVPRHSPISSPAPTNYPPQAVPAKKPWGSILGGVAAGAGLGWLAHSMTNNVNTNAYNADKNYSNTNGIPDTTGGFGDIVGMFGQMLMWAMLGALAWVGLKTFRNRKSSANLNRSRNSYDTSMSKSDSIIDLAPLPRPYTYNTDKIGNDASARPWEQPATSMIGRGLGGNGLSGSQSWGIPVDFDTTGFIHAAKRNFTALQTAWDKADVNTLQSMMTTEMAQEINSQLAQRNTANVTEIVTLDANLLGIEEQSNAYMASVEFSGLIKEDQYSGAVTFREVWNMTKTKHGGNWLVAGIQALD